jgi:hypothetical protein
MGFAESGSDFCGKLKNRWQGEAKQSWEISMENSQGVF